MVFIELIIAVNYFPGNCQRPIKLETLTSGAAVNVVSRTVVGFMRKDDHFSILRVIPCSVVLKASAIFSICTGPSYLDPLRLWLLPTIIHACFMRKGGQFCLL